MEVEGIYVVLATIGTPGRYHWGVYFKLGASMGLVSHAIHPEGSIDSTEWVLEQRTLKTLEISVSLVLALKIGSLKASRYISYQRALADPELMRESGPEEEEFTCRVWVLRALEALNSAGYIRCAEPRKVEVEAIEQADQAYGEYVGVGGCFIKISQYSS